MNKLELVPSIRAASTYGGINDQASLHLTIRIDGVSIGDRHVVDWRELWRALREPGEYFFWTSLRGEPLEENIQNPTFVERDEVKRTVSWRTILPVSLNDPEIEDDELDVTFSFEDYEGAYRSAWWGARKILQLNSGVRVLPEGGSPSQIVGLYEFLKTDAAKPVTPSYAPYRYPSGAI